jgi:hypothetical protein
MSNIMGSDGFEDLWMLLLDYTEQYMNTNSELLVRPPSPFHLRPPARRDDDDDDGSLPYILIRLLGGGRLLHYYARRPKP